MRRKTYYDLLTEAIDHFAEHGYTSAADLERWVQILKQSANQTLRKAAVSEAQIRRSLRATYHRMVVGGTILKKNRGVGKFDIRKLAPAMKRDMERRIFASANLIKLNREEAISETLRGFQGWVTSIPAGGSRAVDRKAEKDRIRKPLSQVDFRERRVIVDQSHKFASSLSETIATHNDAIAAEWHSNWRRPGYQFREDHKDRDLLVYAVRDNWAIREGYMKAGPNGYTDEITKPAEEIFCSCTYTYFYSLASIPVDMLTAKGKGFLARVQH